MVHSLQWRWEKEIIEWRISDSHFTQWKIYQLDRGRRKLRSRSRSHIVLFILTIIYFFLTSVECISFEMVNWFINDMQGFILCWWSILLTTNSPLSKAFTSLLKFWICTFTLFVNLISSLIFGRFIFSTSNSILTLLFWHGGNLF